MLFLLYVFCSFVPVIGHIITGFVLGWGMALSVVGLQVLTLLPIIGPIIAFFLFGFHWGIGLFVIQIFVFFGLAK